MMRIHHVAVVCMTLAALALLTLAAGSVAAQAPGKADSPKEGDPKPAPKPDKKELDKAQAAALAAIYRNRRSELISTDFLQADARGNPQTGITAEELSRIEMTIKALIESVLEKAERQLADPGDNLREWCADALIALYGCGMRTDSDLSKRMIAAMVKGYDGVGGPENPCDGVDTFQAGTVLVALWRLAEARLREQADKPSASGKGLPDWDKTEKDVKQRGAVLRALLQPKELAAANCLRDTIIRRQVLKVPPDNPMGTPVVGSFGSEFKPSWGGSGMDSYYALSGLMAAVRLGFEPPLAANMELCAEYLAIIQQSRGVEMTLYYMDAKPLEAKEPKPGKRAMRQSRVETRGWSGDLSFSMRDRGTPNKNARDGESAELQETACAVSALLLTRWLAAAGAPSQVGKPIAGKSDLAIEGGLAWLARVFELDTPTQQRPPEQGEDMGGDRYPGGPVLGEQCRAVGVMCVLSGSEFVGTCEWYPVGARHFVKSLAKLRASYEKRNAPEVPAEGEKGKAAGKPDGGAAEKPAKAAKEPEAEDAASTWLEIGPDTLIFLLSGLDKTPGGNPNLAAFFKDAAQPVPSEAPEEGK